MLEPHKELRTSLQNLRFKYLSTILLLVKYHNNLITQITYKHFILQTWDSE